MKKIVLLLLFLSGVVAAQGQSCKSIPVNPIVGERFQLVCRIQLTSGETPFLSFTKTGVEVLGKKVSDVSIRSTVKNGKITTFKEKKFVYDLIASKPGRKKISNIRVESGGESRKLRDVMINVSRMKLKAKNVFTQAETVKRQVYVGEGFDVNYYLYYKVKKEAHGIEEWPKIENFYKRDLSLLGNENVESVEYDGEIYQRVLIYSIKLFGEKAGTFSVSPIKVNIQYRGTRKFGMLGRYASSLRKSLRSKPLKVEVVSLPVKNVPKSFTGLVGKHDFELTILKKKYIVNEPIEVKLAVSGNGNLEQYSAPELYRNGNLEEFDKQSEILKDDKSGYKKIIDYTYLARSEINLKIKKIKVSYFSLKDGKYHLKEIPLPALMIRGMSQTAKPLETKIFVPTEESISLTKLVAPVFGIDKTGEYGVLYFNIILSIIIILFLMSFVDWRDKMPGVDHRLAGICRSIKRNGPRYSPVFKLMEYLRTSITREETSLKRIIGTSKLSDNSKRYFEHLVDISEAMTYNKKIPEKQFRYRKKYFQEFVGYVTRVKANEDSKQNSGS